MYYYQDHDPEFEFEHYGVMNNGEVLSHEECLFRIMTEHGPDSEVDEDEREKENFDACFLLREMSLENTSKKLENRLNILNHQLVKLEASLNDPIKFTNDECMEMKRLIQLDAQETNDRIKKNEKVNAAELTENINKQSELIISKIAEYQNEAISFHLNSKQNDEKSEINNLVNKLKQFSENWKPFWNPVGIRNSDEEVAQATNQMKLNEDI